VGRAHTKGLKFGTNNRKAGAGCKKKRKARGGTGQRRIRVAGQRETIGINTEERTTTKGR
jgi:hypothetical protein